ncbi:MAG: low molecular weight phosphotyrosine protein phosphatase [Oscillospiraceae bacterium]|nr:low molecular weight phosphotyrosine protein phosphatase [Oscillospiraceae bacterium]
MVKILFVCHGNICRSPMAEFVLKYMTQDRDDLYIASAATSTEEIGNGVHYGTVGILKKNGIPNPGHRAIQMKRADYDEYDYIIGMDEWNVRNILRITGGDPAGKVHKLLDFTERGGDIADPWYTHDFETTYRDVYEGCKALLEEL